MKFQNPSLNFFLNGGTDTCTDKPKPICSPLFQSWGHEYQLFEKTVDKICKKLNLKPINPNLKTSKI